MRYTSPLSLFGLPLVEVVIPSPPAPGAPPERPVARGWLAVGPIAVGVVAFGGLAFGGLALGGLALGALSVGGLAVGALALGGGAIGYWAMGGGALAVDAAMGGLAVAGRYALGGAAFAPHANDPEAVEFFRSGFVFPGLRFAAGNARWLLLLIFLPIVFPFFGGKRARGGSGGVEPK